MKKVLTKEFFNRGTITVAKELLGKFLLVRTAKRGGVKGKETAVMITEVEAYDGHNDKASHASKGKTKRTAIMFGQAGQWYVYLIYGMYDMLNIVTGPKDYPAAVLIRGVVDESGQRLGGPGKLTKALKITKKFHNQVASKKTGLYIEDRGVKIPKNKIKKSTRVGVAYAGPIWSKKEWRFYLALD